MGVISYGKSNEETWYVANWAYRRFLLDVMAISESDEIWRFTLEQAAALGGLSLHLIDNDNPQLAGHLRAAIKDIAKSTLEGSSNNSRLQWMNGLDEHERAMYLDGIQSLVGVFEYSEGAG